MEDNSKFSSEANDMLNELYQLDYEDIVAGFVMIYKCINIIWYICIFI